MLNPRILILDTYYSEVIRSMPIDPAKSYESNLAAIMQRSFGTADFYSRNLRALGWDAEDVIVNHDQLNALGANDDVEEPDVVFLQDLSIDYAQGSGLFGPKFMAAQLSCPWPSDEAVRRCEVIFTSFPHYVKRIEALGVKAVYNPLAFDPIVLDRIGPLPAERIHDVVFIGGLGRHWQRGQEMLNAVAEAIPTFKWWGYGADLLPSNSALRQKYQGEAWGLDMYRILLQSKIVVNRHGEVAEGFTNNMRCFEVTGCGAVLMTEDSSNLRNFFKDDEVVGYGSANDLISRIQYFLNHDRERQEYADRAQVRCLNEHTYDIRMKTISDTLRGLLNG